MAVSYNRAHPDVEDIELGFFAKPAFTACLA